MFDFDEFWKRWTKIAGVQGDAWCADHDELLSKGRDTWRSEESDVRFNFADMEFYGDRILDCEVEEDEDDIFLTIHIMLSFNPVIPGDDEYSDENYTNEAVRDATTEWKGFIKDLTNACRSFGRFVGNDFRTYPVCEIFSSSPRPKVGSLGAYEGIYIEARMQVMYSPEYE